MASTRGKRVFVILYDSRCSYRFAEIEAKVVTCDQAHALIDPWLTEESLKKSKAQLIRLLADFDRQFGHGGEGGMDSRSEQAVFGLRISNK